MPEKNEIQPRKVFKTDEQYMELARSSRRIAKRIAPLVTKDTLMVGVDKGARFFIHPLRKALKEQGSEVPQKVHFINYSAGRSALNNPFTKKKRLQEEVSERLKEIEKQNGKPFSRIVIVDDFALNGKTLRHLKNAFSGASGKPVHTVAFAIDNTPVYMPDVVDLDSKLSDAIKEMGDGKNIVRDAPNIEKKLIRGTLPSKIGLGSYKEHIERVNAAFESREPAVQEKKPLFGKLKEKASSVKGMLRRG